MIKHPLAKALTLSLGVAAGSAMADNLMELAQANHHRLVRS